MTNLTKKVYIETIKYLKDLGVRIPEHEVFFKDSYSCSYVERSWYEINLVLGKYITNRTARRFVMHELVHVIAAQKRLPVKYSKQKSISEKLPLHWLSGLPDIVRPCGYASWYGKLSNGEEALAELLGWVYSNGNFGETQVPEDLASDYKKAFAWLKK